MKIYARRLTKGMDLKEEIERIASSENVGAGVVLSSVGCVSLGRFRLADGESIKVMDEDLEILSLNGTLSKEGLHLHVSYGDIEGRAWGGHLTEGNIINTTCELVIGILSEERFTRKPDESTGYDELVIEK
ncbi:DNA-binding protein [Propionigenium maris DSM 9537]|uniref:DNA-binding protein n=1 Tax=Propionigenium maris DSM 9537 TaxID=1123000 RepID=A0A9W6GPX4_9FUSO|nr:PPC domain-containing DNA-binding protein [Propionigenium maris]GLI58330.1 DNA-binding protein [Propionigenium maris DSM 9537]